MAIEELLSSYAAVDALNPRRNAEIRGIAVPEMSEWCVFCNEVHHGPCPIAAEDQRSAIESAVLVERERCAKIADVRAVEGDENYEDGEAETAREIAAKIRSGE